MTAPARVVIADDHEGFRDGLATLLESAGVQVLAQTGTGREAVAAARSLEPDVVVMDLQMPDLNGIEATRELVASSPSVGVLVLTMFEDDASLGLALQAGAGGYLLKGARQAEIVQAIEAVRQAEGRR